MTAPDPRLDEIQARLSAATPGPWDTVQDTYRSIPMHRIGSEETGSDVAQVVMHGSHDVADAEFIATAPGDLAYLLAELRKARKALARVEAECSATDAETEEALQADLVTRIRAAVAAAKGDEQ